MRIRDLFEKAVEMPTEMRELFIDQNCGDDDGLRDEIKSLLASDVAHRSDVSRGPLTGAIGAAVDATTKSRREELLGSTIGPYRLTQVLGHGGAGTVYLGERADRQYSAQVAVKVVEGAALNAEIGRRFKAERQILASLNHQNIARLIDAGETQDGYPYLVMEYVHGEPIDKYCDRKKLNVEERIDLMLKVCGAIQYAHQNLIVHRDIKPGNILVMPDGTPKLLDFGIAKLLDTSDAAAAMALTRMNDRVLTPEYASPEQILGQTITTASDVYSLGMVLFELLTGLRPYKISTSSQLELERTICVIDSSRASTVVRQALTRVASETPHSRDIYTIAESRQITPMRLRARLNGDLDAILARALRKEAVHRYNSVEQFSDDLRRHLAREPVQARQGNWAYYMQRFARRHTFGVAAGTGFVVLITAALVVVSMQSKRIAEERDAANRERQTSEAVASFMTNVFDAADPFSVQDKEVTAKELLDNAAERIRNDLNQEPAVKARLLEQIGRSYEHQGYAQLGVGLLEESLKIKEQQLGTNDPSLAATLQYLGNLQLDQGSLDSSRASFKRARSILQLNSLENSAAYATLLSDSGKLELNANNLEVAASLLNEAIPLLQATFAKDHTLVGTALTRLARVRIWHRNFQDAEPLAREAVRIQSSRLPELHPESVLAISALGESLLGQGKASEAAPYIEKALENSTRIYGSDSSRLTFNLQLIIDLRRAQNRLPEAAQFAQDALDVSLRRYGDNNQYTAYTRTTLGIIEWQLGNYAKAESELRRAIEIYGNSLPPTHAYVTAAEYYLAEALLAQRKYDETIALSRLTLEKLAAAKEPATRVARSQSTLGQALLARNQVRDGRQLLENSYQILSLSPSANTPALKLTRERLRALGLLAADDNTQPHD